MTTIFEALRDDHEVQRTLAATLIETSGDSDGRTELFERLQRELESHAGAEERFFYVPLMEHDVTQDKARHSVSEHKELDDYIDKLRGYDRSAPQWLITARELVERLEHHLDEEEHEVFQLAGKALTDEEKTRLAADYCDDMRRRRDEAS